MKRYWMALVALAGLNACGLPMDGLPYYRSADLTPEWLSESDAEHVHRVPDFKLLDQSNETVTGEDLDGHVVVASFFFTSCAQVCPILRSRLAEVQDEFLNDERVLLLSHSIMPEADSVPGVAFEELSCVILGAPIIRPSRPRKAKHPANRARIVRPVAQAC